MATPTVPEQLESCRMRAPSGHRVPPGLRDVFGTLYWAARLLAALDRADRSLWVDGLEGREARWLKRRAVRRALALVRSRIVEAMPYRPCLDCDEDAREQCQSCGGKGWQTAKEATATLQQRSKELSVQAIARRQTRRAAWRAGVRYTSAQTKRLRAWCEARKQQRARRRCLSARAFAPSGD